MRVSEMALFALPGRTFVNHYGAPRDLTALVVTKLAGDPLVSPIEREGGMTAVIEFGGPPTQDGVAAGAGVVTGGGAELTVVHVGMAAGAVLGGAAEGDGAHAGARGLLHGGLVAGQAI